MPSPTRCIALFVLCSVVLCLPSQAAKKSEAAMASFAKYTQIPGAKAAGSDVCATCHAEISKEGGLLFYYGSYRDYWNPNLNGDLRTFNVYVGRRW